MLVAADEGVEQERVDVLGLSVGTDAGIERGGAGLDEHGDGGGVGLSGTAGKQGTGDRKQEIEKSEAEADGKARGSCRKSRCAASLKEAPGIGHDFKHR
jgi:hypothetical protein